jgi:hypothetical protein
LGSDAPACLRERPGEDPFAGRRGFTLQPDTLACPSRWEGSTSINSEAPELERAQFGIANIIARELPSADEHVLRRITERAVKKLQRIVHSVHWANPEPDEKAGYQVARTVAEEIPDVDRAAARRIGTRVVERMFDLFPDSL